MRWAQLLSPSFFFLAKDTESKKGNELAQATCQVTGALKAQKVWIQNLRYYPDTCAVRQAIFRGREWYPELSGLTALVRQVGDVDKGLADSRPTVPNGI